MLFPKKSPQVPHTIKKRKLYNKHNTKEQMAIYEIHRKKSISPSIAADKNKKKNKTANQNDFYFRQELKKRNTKNKMSIHEIPKNKAFHKVSLQIKQEKNETANQLLLLLRPPQKPLLSPQNQPRTQKNHPKIKPAKRQKDPKIHPLLRIKHVEALRVLVAGGVLAKLAQPVHALLDIAAVLGDEVERVGLAGLAGRGGKPGEFVGGADQGAIVDGDAEEAFEEVVEWGEVVHP